MPIANCMHQRACRVNQQPRLHIDDGIFGFPVAVGRNKSHFHDRRRACLVQHTTCEPVNPATVPPNDFIERALVTATRKPHEILVGAHTVRDGRDYYTQLLSGSRNCRGLARPVRTTRGHEGRILLQRFLEIGVHVVPLHGVFVPARGERMRVSICRRSCWTERDSCQGFRYCKHLRCNDSRLASSSQRDAKCANVCTRYTNPRTDDPVCREGQPCPYSTSSTTEPTPRESAHDPCIGDRRRH